MKKYLSIIGLVLFAVVAMAQERTVKATLKSDATYVSFPVTAADTLKEINQDTIDYWLTNMNREAIEKIVFTMSVDTLAGADSIYYSLYGYNNDDNTGTAIISATGLLVNKSNQIVDISKWYWTNATTYVDLSYRFYRLRFIQDDANTHDGGAKFDYLIAKVYLK